MHKQAHSCKMTEVTRVVLIMEYLAVFVLLLYISGYCRGYILRFPTVRFIDDAFPIHPNTYIVLYNNICLREYCAYYISAWCVVCNGTGAFVLCRSHLLKCQSFLRCQCRKLEVMVVVYVAINSCFCYNNDHFRICPVCGRRARYHILVHIYTAAIP